MSDIEEEQQSTERKVSPSPWNDVIKCESEDMVMKMSALQLVDFVETKKTEIKDSFSVSGFQNFLLKFLREYEREDLEKPTKMRMRIYVDEYKYNVLHEFDKQNLPVLANEFSWITAALGLGNFFKQKFTTEKCRQIFYESKFDEELSILRFPVSKIPPKIKHLVPKDHGFQTVVTETSRLGVKYFRKFEMPTADVNVFFTILTTMFFALKHGRVHEVLYFASLLLCNNDNMKDCFIKWNYLQVWGALAVVLAKLQKPKHLTEACLRQMRALAQFTSDNLDCFLFEQRVAMSYGENKKEQELNNSILSIVPATSKFFARSVLIHVSAKRRQIEDLLAFAFVCLASERDDRDNIRKCLKKIFKLELFMHKICSNPNINLKCKQKIHVSFGVLDLYKIVLEKLSVTDSKKRKRVEVIAKNMDEKNHHTKAFLKLFVDDAEFSKSDYRQQMMEIKELMEDKTRRAASISWANIVFVHYILLNWLVYISFKIIKAIF